MHITTADLGAIFTLQLIGLPPTAWQNKSLPARWMRLVVTDLYVANRGNGAATLQLIESRTAGDIPTEPLDQSRFAVRYVFRTDPRQVISLSFASGLVLGYYPEPEMAEFIVRNAGHSDAELDVTLCGLFVAP